MRHGVKKSQISKTDPELLENYKNLKSYFLQNKSIFNQEIFNQTTKLLELNLEFYTVWNYRRKSIPIIFTQDLTDKLIQELNFTFSCLLKSPKSYWVWNHRKWILDSLNSQALWEKELQNVSKMLDLDVRNFHAWDYRRWILKKIQNYSLLKEWEYTTSKICQNFSNFSAWHYRSKLLVERQDDIRVKGIFLVSDFKELEWVRKAIFTEPEDQAPWYYHRILLGKDDSCLPDEIWKAEYNCIQSLLELEPDCKCKHDILR